MSPLRLERALGILSLQYSPEKARHWPSLVVAGKVGLLAVRTLCQKYFPTTARRTMNGERHDILFDASHPLVLRGFGVADSARDPAWDPRLARLLALAQGAEVWMKLSGIGRVADSWAQAAAAKMLEELGPKQLLWARSGRTSQPPTPTRHPMRRRLSGLRSSSQTRTPEGESSARRLRPFTDFGELRTGHLPK